MSIDREKFPPLYRTVAINDDGLNSHSYVPGGLDVVTSSPLSETPGANPEQFLGLALSTCLNATLEAIEKMRHLPHTSQVHTIVEYARDTKGFQFYVTAQIRIPDVDRQTAIAMADLAERRCPVAKLLGGSPNVTVALVDQFSDVEPVTVKAK
ncbi:OsmC family protein [Levilactobacillus acidifarinae]|uniref:Redox protein, regulator of disulfide bond formation n=1 Tax=Levilactobacillus acidifarinae DSM 19394 = JCM 15949 TaxID=1423715 RepID=A0A0R1LK59_9LACO|nr:OsmC family protein [Levilactobacillus acidifarinae]KRK96348.1 redox protein, regulator of disulfide bond formation [Levilactobacillus acidifarinae DSM 19394]GEO69068.1 dihydroneopterin aldolase [Levilactobacillus acidifarinae]